MSTEKTDVVDLDAFDSVIKRQNDGMPVEIKAMDGKTPLGLTITIAGPDSDFAQTAREELQDEAVDAETFRLSPKDMDERGLRYLAKVTLAWSAPIRMGGVDLPLNEENAMAVYRKYRFIREQIDRKANNRALFSKG